MADGSPRREPHGAPAPPRAPGRRLGGLMLRPHAGVARDCGPFDPRLEFAGDELPNGDIGSTSLGLGLADGTRPEGRLPLSPPNHGPPWGQANLLHPSSR